MKNLVILSPKWAGQCDEKVREGSFRQEHSRLKPLSYLHLDFLADSPSLVSLGRCQLPFFLAAVASKTLSERRCCSYLALFSFHGYTMLQWIPLIPLIPIVPILLAAPQAPFASRSRGLQ